MRGAKFGTIKSVKGDIATVRLDKVKKLARVKLPDLTCYVVRLIGPVDGPHFITGTRVAVVRSEGERIYVVNVTSGMGLWSDVTALEHADE
jgi:hypothetical protein